MWSELGYQLFYPRTNPWCGLNLRVTKIHLLSNEQKVEENQRDRRCLKRQAHLIDCGLFGALWFLFGRRALGCGEVLCDYVDEFVGYMGFGEFFC